MRRAPGFMRRFAFEEWPQFAKRGWDELRSQARAQERPPPAAIEASDQDAGAVAATRENASKAGVALQISQRRLLDLPAGSGLVACNPPYGVRIAAGSVWRDLGEAVHRRASWRVAAVIADEKAAFESRLRFAQMAKTETGGLRIALSLAQP
ncbi:MAG TPA: RNA methyltransferase, partial [Myxococcales bacterium]|nr:RNA methyltransferase [Myxococcales bacterium]